MQHDLNSGVLNYQENEIIQQIVQHDRDMATCAHLLQNLPPQTPPSPTPVIWAPLIQAPLQAAAATTSVAIALTHHPHLPPTLFRPPVSVLGSLKDPSNRLKKFPAFVPPSPAPDSTGNSPSSTPSKLRTGVDMSLLASFRAQHMTSGTSAAGSSQQASSSAVNHGPNGAGAGAGTSGGGASAFPFGPFSSSGSPSSSMAQLHSQPQNQQPFRSSTPPLSNLFHQGSTSGSTGSGISGGAVGACGGATGWSSGGAVGGSAEGDTSWAGEDFTTGTTEVTPGGNFGLGRASCGSVGEISGESIGGISETSVVATCGKLAAGAPFISGPFGDGTRRSMSGTSKGSLKRASRGSVGGTSGESSVALATGGSLGRGSGGSIGMVSGVLTGGASGGSLVGTSGDSLIGNPGTSFGKTSVGLPSSHIGGGLSGPGGGAIGGHVSRAVGGTVGGHIAGPTVCPVGGTSSGITPGYINSSRCQSPISAGSSSSTPSQLLHSQPPPKPPQVAPLQQFAGGGRTTSGLNLFHTPSQGSPSSSRGQHSHQPPEGSPSALSHISLTGLQSGLLPHQVSMERSALASLAQYGSANASPCLTPVAPSPTIQSPVAGRTFHYSDPSSATGSHSSLLMPQSSLPSQLPSQPQTTGRDSPLGRFSEDLKLLSSSHPTLHQEVSGHHTPPPSVETGYYPSPFSSPTLVPKPCSSVPGRMTPPTQMSPGYPHQTQSPGTSPASHLRRGSVAYSSDLEPQTVRSKLPSNL